MLCNKCNKNEAKIYYTEIINGVMKEQHLCEECATECTSFQKGTSLMNQELTLGNLLSTILGNYYVNTIHEEGPKEQEIHCDGCEMTYSEFMRLGKFGCDKCYDSFQKVLAKSIKSIQGSDTHTGKKPRGFESKTDKIIKELSEIDKLSIRLQDAIEKEEFEEAVKIRDKIRELKKGEMNHA